MFKTWFTSRNFCAGKIRRGRWGEISLPPLSCLIAIQTALLWAHFWIGFEWTNRIWDKILFKGWQFARICEKNWPEKSAWNSKIFQKFILYNGLIFLSWCFCDATWHLRRWKKLPYRYKIRRQKVTKKHLISGHQRGNGLLCPLIRSVRLLETLFLKIWPGKGRGKENCPLIRGVRVLEYPLIGGFTVRGC